MKKNEARLKEDADIFIMDHPEILVHMHSKKHQHKITTEKFDGIIRITIKKTKHIYHLLHPESDQLTLCGKEIHNEKTHTRYWISKERPTCNDCKRIKYGDENETII